MYPVASPSQGNVIMMMLMNCSNKLPAASLFLFGRVPVFFEHVSCHEVLQESLASQSGSEPEPVVTKLQNGSVRRIRKPPKEFCLIQQIQEEWSQYSGVLEYSKVCGEI